MSSMIRQRTFLQRLSLIRSNNPSRKIEQHPRFASNQTSSGSSTSKDAQKHEQKASRLAQDPQLKKTMAQLDEELKLKLEGVSGEGGEAGLELEGGKPVSMKRGVRENMFRYI